MATLGLPEYKIVIRKQESSSIRWRIDLTRSWDAEKWRTEEVTNGM